MSPQNSLLGLPYHILVEIFLYFKDPQDSFPARAYWKECMSRRSIKTRRQDVQNARLVCRLFEELASPLLFSDIEIDISRKSLDFIHKISERPLIAKGIRRIRVFLYYLPGQVASDISHFKANRMAKLDSFYDHYLDRQDDLLFEGTGLDMPRVMQVYGDIDEAWDAYFDPTNYNVMPQEHSTYQQCLLEGYQDFREQQEEQSPLITQRIFVTCLARSLAQMPPSCSLSLTDSMDAYPLPWGFDPTLVFSSTDALSRYMTAPCVWKEFEDFEEEASALPARILSDLPVALQEHGCSPRQLDVECLTTIRELCFRSPIPPKLENPGWDDQILKYAYKDLEAFRFTQCAGVWAGHIRQPIPSEKLNLFEGFLLSILSSCKLRHICIDLFGLGRLNDVHALADYYTLAPAFRFSNWPNLRIFYLSFVSLDQASLESLFKAPGPNLRNFSLHCVKLKGGFWSNALDMLQDTIRLGRAQERCAVVFECLSGGEFEKEECKAINRMNRALLRRKGWEFNEGDSIPVQLARMYVRNAAMTQNPLRADMEQIILEGPPSYLERK